MQNILFFFEIWYILDSPNIEYSRFLGNLAYLGFDQNVAYVGFSRNIEYSNIHGNVASSGFDSKTRFRVLPPPPYSVQSRTVGICDGGRQT